MKYLLHNVEKRQDWGEIQSRLNYYCQNFSFDESVRLQWEANCVSISKQKVGSPKTYYLDTLRYGLYFPNSYKWKIEAGDVNYVPEFPSLTKSRPILGNNANAVLLNMDKVRHFVFVNDTISWRRKKDMVVFRGAIGQKELFAFKKNRHRFMEMYFNHPMVDAGEVIEGGKCVNDLWKKPKLSIREHLKFKFIMALEGNDVASNLKWIMSSNSIAVMPRPKFETWFMEGTLIPNYHYIEIKDDFSDLEERLNYYINHPDEAEDIIRHANEYVSRFRHSDREDIISILVLDRYLQKTNNVPSVLKPWQRVEQQNHRDKPVFWQLSITTKKLNQKMFYTASLKARKDVERTISHLNLPTLEFCFARHSFRLSKRTSYMVDARRIKELTVEELLQTQHGDYVLVQYPNIIEYEIPLLETLKEHHLKIHLLIHDILSLRLNGVTSKDEVRTLNLASVLYVHTESMKEELIRAGVTSEMKVMHLFDYYVQNRSSEILLKYLHAIAYAGNLDKSGFIKELIDTVIPDSFSFRFYGVYPQNIDFINNSQMYYAGCFSPDKPTISEAGWGLVWDGDCLDRCDGAMGEYLKYNASHKASLYLGLGIPVIVWSRSALAEWVIEKGVGIAVDSLNDIYGIIKDLKVDVYGEMLANCRAIAHDLHHGKALGRLIKSNAHSDSFILPQITIVTVCRNAREALRKTLNSVLEQDYPDFELVVIDGDSSDGTKEMLEELDMDNVRWISETDSGIYDAMNKGVSKAKGEFCIFMNAGDTFATQHSMKYVMLRLHRNSDVIYGDIFKNGKRVNAASARNSHRMYYCHQAVFVRTEVLKRFPFDTKYRMSADFKQAKQMYLAGCKFQRVNVVVCNYDVNGVSNVRRSDGLLENISIVKEIDDFATKMRLLPHLYLPYIMAKLRGK